MEMIKHIQTQRYIVKRRGLLAFDYCPLRLTIDLILATRCCF